MSANEGMEKQNVVYTCNGILVLKRKEVLIHATTLKNLESIVLSKISQTHIRTNIVKIPVVHNI